MLPTHTISPGAYNKPKSYTKNQHFLANPPPPYLPGPKKTPYVGDGHPPFKKDQKKVNPTPVDMVNIPLSTRFQTLHPNGG